MEPRPAMTDEQINWICSVIEDWMREQHKSIPGIYHYTHSLLAIIRGGRITSKMLDNINKRVR